MQKGADPCAHYGQKTGKKFKTMMMREENGVRTWRIE
jgi:hypothetical protein